MPAEEWLPIPGYEGIYSVSNLGNIMSMNYANTGMLRLMIPGKRNGYLKVDLYKNTVKKSHAVHQIVMQAFVGPQNGLYVNHKNGVKTDNSLSNLEYCTHSENMKHAFRTGLSSSKGEKHSQSKFTDAQVLEIKYRLSNGESRMSLAKEYGVTHSTISRIATGDRWGHITLIRKVG